METIKFKGRRIDNGEWVEGHYFVSPLTDENSGTQPAFGWCFLSDGITRHCIATKSGVVFIVEPKSVQLTSAVKPDRDELGPSVLAMARMMQYKLDKNKHKECSVMNPDGKGRGWDNCSIDWLIMRLLKELVEMQEALLGGQPPIEIAKECADICNFAMMIADNIGGLKEENEYLQSSPEPKEKEL